MKKIISVFYFVSVLLLLLSGISHAEEVMVDRIVAIVGDQIILLSDVQQKMRQEMINRKYNSNTSSQILNRLQTEILRGMIDDNLLHTKAERDSIIADPRDVDQFFNEHMTELKQNLGSEENFQEALTELGMTEQQLRFMFRSMAEKRVIEQMFLQEIRRRISVTPQDMEAWYVANKDSLPVIEEQFKISHIVIVPGVLEERKAEARKKLEGIMERARSGEDFAGLAKQFSEDPGSASGGGDLGYFARGVMIKEFS
ncbi:MAG TPA: peptidylprolyl isomerase, partial [Anaerolineae bacterium]|nr:peptidylprolyl isomerase [Anaerolineae bacterium]